MNSETTNETANEIANADADAPADDQTPSADEYLQENDQENSQENILEEGGLESGNATMSNAAPSSDTGVVAGDAATPAASPRLAPVESMEVRIDFEVGRVTLPVSSLANVATGSVIEMPGVSLDRVIAKSGGQAFAFGEFVELGGRVGFRILSLKEAKEKP